MSPDDPIAVARKQLSRNLKSRRRPAGGAWFPATPANDATRTGRAEASAAPAAVAPPAAPPAPVRHTPAAGPDLFGTPATPKSQDVPVFASEGTPRPARREDRVAELENLARHAEACRRCTLGSGRTQAVFGVGNPEARLMFVGEGPGRDEDAQGEPFVGRAGQKLNSLIEKLGLRREDVYIANVVKCRPPENRTPLPEESAACFPYLRRQIELIAPRIIIALGLPAAQTLLGVKQSMAQFRRQQYRLGDAVVIATYHPAYVLRNPPAAWDVWNDVKMVPEMLQQP